MFSRYLTLLALPALALPALACGGPEDPDQDGAPPSEVSSPTVTHADIRAPATSFLPDATLAGFCPAPRIFGSGDFNGDGRTDFACHDSASGQTRLALTRMVSGTLTFDVIASTTLQSWCPGGRVLAARLDGDAITDLLCHRPSVQGGTVITMRGSTTGAFSPLWSTTGWCGGSASVYVADVSGDGRPDLVCATTAQGGSVTADVRVGVNGSFNGTGGFAATTLCSTAAPHQVGVADFNGDGVSDAYCHDSSTGQNWVTLSSRTSFQTRQNWLPSWCAFNEAFGIGDFDGDRRTDFWCRSSDRSMWVAISSGTGMISRGSWLADFCAQTGDVLLGDKGLVAPADLADFNGDGKTDIACHRQSSGGVTVGLSVPSRNMFADGTTWQIDACPSGSTMVTGAFRDTRRTIACADPAANGAVSVSRSNWAPLPYGGGRVMTTPKVHLIFYGQWNPFGPEVTRVRQFFDDLSGSPWYSIMTTYRGRDLRPVSPRFPVSGIDFDYYSIGNTFGFRGIDIINNNVDSAEQDENTVYTLIFSSDITGWGYCAAKCAQHLSDVNPVNGKRLVWTMNGTGCPACALTNAPGADPSIEGALTAMAHELVESVSDPWGAGWINGTDTENADLCQWSFGDVKDAGGGKQYNLEANGRRYLLQQNWVAIDDQIGFCATSHPYAPLDFSAGDIQLPAGTTDWQPNSYKAECAAGAGVSGLSHATSNGRAHEALCKQGGNPPALTRQGCYTRNFAGADSRGAATGDWDPGFFKGECALDEYVAGVSQTPAGAMTAIRCCKAAAPHSACSALASPSTDARESKESGDWDPGFAKLECGRGRYAAGVSRHTTSGAPHALWCCGY